MTLGPPSRLRYLALVLAVVLVGAKGNGCNCKGQPDDEPDVVVEEPEPIIPAAVEVELQVVSIDPAAVAAGRAFEARIYGSGFEPRARVHLGDVPAEDVKVGASGNSIRLNVPPLVEGYHDVTVTNLDGVSAVLRRGLYVEEGRGDCKFLAVFFQFDRAGLTPEANDAIDGFVPCYKSSAGRIRVEGHADERGTTDYNLALGERRADTVSRYLTAKGISPSRVDTLSYGEERPMNAGHDERAWSENRRVEIHAP